MRLRLAVFSISSLLFLIYIFISSELIHTSAYKTINASIGIEEVEPEQDYEEEEKDSLTFIKNQIFNYNTQQKIHNEHDFPRTDLVIVVQVHDRLIYLKELIRSLSETQEIQNTLVIFSHDVYNKTINGAVKEIKFCKTMQIFFPFSIQSHPDKFPGIDQNDCTPNLQLEEALKIKCKNAFYQDGYKHYRDANAAQIKHHWWWKINFAFKQIRFLHDYIGNIVLLEEDHYVAPDFIYVLRMMRQHANQECPNCYFFALGIHGHEDFTRHNQVAIQAMVENVGLTFNRSVFNEISRRAEDFCGYDDYNWDWTLRYMSHELFNPHALSMILTASRLKHIGLCGIHTKNKNCNPDKLIQDYKNSQSRGSLFPTSLATLSKNLDFKKANPFGGFSDPRDYALCVAM